MLTELRAKSQITLPNLILKRIGLSVGDLLEVREMDGGVFMIPVVITPKKPRAKTDDERHKILRSLCGSINDPTMVEPPKIEYESPREKIT